jgi:hypothetical protein
MPYVEIIFFSASTSGQVFFDRYSRYVFQKDEIGRQYLC